MKERKKKTTVTRDSRFEWRELTQKSRVLLNTRGVVELIKWLFVLQQRPCMVHLQEKRESSVIWPSCFPGQGVRQLENVRQTGHGFHSGSACGRRQWKRRKGETQCQHGSGRKKKKVFLWKRKATKKKKPSPCLTLVLLITRDLWAVFNEVKWLSITNTTGLEVC